MAIGDISRKYQEQKAKAVEYVAPPDDVVEDEPEETVEDKVEAVTTPAVSLTFEQMKELFAAAQGSRVTDAQIADIAANAAVKAKMPENKVAPGVSVFSHPEGERDHPKDKLKCRMYLGSAPIEGVTCTPAEIASLNRVSPGVYRVQKTDGSTAVVEVTGQVNANRQIERLWIMIPKEDENKNGYGRTLHELTDQLCEANRVAMVGV